MEDVTVAIGVARKSFTFLLLFNSLWGTEFAHYDHVHGSFLTLSTENIKLLLLWLLICLSYPYDSWSRYLSLFVLLNITYNNSMDLTDAKWFQASKRELQRLYDKMSRQLV